MRTERAFAAGAGSAEQSGGNPEVAAGYHAVRRPRRDPPIATAAIFLSVTGILAQTPRNGTTDLSDALKTPQKAEDDTAV